MIPFASEATAVRWLVASLVMLAVFTATFDADVNSWLVNGTWLIAVALWAYGIGRGDVPSAGPHPSRRDVWLFAIFAGVFVAAWLPLYDNWRWTQAGDSGGWFCVPADAVNRGLPRSLLSVRGIWDLMTYTSLIVDNGLMFVFGPTFFWHRVGKLVISVLALLSIYTFFALVLDSPWALAVVVVTSATLQWEIFSHISMNHVDSFIFAYAMLTAFILVVRQPERRTRWMALGLVGGGSLFFTQTAWTEVAACGALAGLWALYRRRFVAAAVCALSFVVAGWPVLLQLPDLLRAATLQTRTNWAPTYLSRIAGTIFWLPAGPPYRAFESGWSGPIAGWPCGDFYVVGLVLAALSSIPAVRRRLRVSPACGALLALFLAEIALMALTNNLNASPSPKRTYHLIPLQVFFGLVPFYMLAKIVARFRFAARAVGAMTCGAIALYVVANASFFVYPERFAFGGGVFDGLVQLHQRFPDRQVLLFATQANIKEIVEDPNEMFNSAYHIHDTITVTSTLDTAEVDATCRAGKILCYHNAPSDRATFLQVTAAQHVRAIDLYAIFDVHCVECTDG